MALCSSLRKPIIFRSASSVDFNAVMHFVVQGLGDGKDPKVQTFFFL